MKSFDPNYNNFIDNEIDNEKYNELIENSGNNSEGYASDESESEDEYLFDDNIAIEDKNNIETNIKEHNLIIDAKDRNWYLINPCRYNFEIIFNPTIDSIESKKYPIYENNKTIPTTNEQAKMGLRGNLNNIGFIYNGIKYPNWDNNKHKV